MKKIILAILTFVSVDAYSEIVSVCFNRSVDANINMRLIQRGTPTVRGDFTGQCASIESEFDIDESFRLILKVVPKDRFGYEDLTAQLFLNGVEFNGANALARQKGEPRQRVGVAFNQAVFKNVNLEEPITMAFRIHPRNLDVGVEISNHWDTATWDISRWQ